jgi:hypothetical protein
MADLGAPHPSLITANVKQFITISGLSKDSVYKLIREGEIRSVVICGRRLVDLDSYRSWRELKIRQAPMKLPVAKPPRRIPPIQRPDPIVRDVVYFLEAPLAQLIKIGWTRFLAGRIGALATGSPIPLNLLGCVPGGLTAEQKLHGKFAAIREHGEWFRATPELRKFIARALKAGKLPNG